MSVASSTAVSRATTAPPAGHYRDVRARTRALAAPLSPEDAAVQSMPDASPAKWHLAHSTWFFEQFVLGTRTGYRPVHARWAPLFNSYYQGAGPMQARAQRGVLSRPSLAEVYDYRDEVDRRIAHALEGGVFDTRALQALELGLQHEQQHQELMLTDIKHAFSCSPLQPAYRTDLRHLLGAALALRWQRFDEAVIEIGAPPWPSHARFAFDHESPRHRVLSLPFELASRPVSNAEYRAFIDDGGYRTATLWLSEAWVRVQADGWTRPLYWSDALTHEFTLAGPRAVDPHAPVCHLSYYEADAFARWAGARLPTEAEWERAASATVPSPQDNFAGNDALHPQGRAHADGLVQLYGDVWEWTSSAYGAYPGYRAWPGTLGEYNGKFMGAQWILRGGSCASPRDHLRASYRNFFSGPDRWQFSGLRLARDAA